MSPCTPECRLPSAAQAHCPTCHRTFGGVGGFDAHRRNGACRDPVTVGYENQGGVWRKPMTAQSLAQLRGR